MRPIYFDNHATTPLDPRVLEAMLPYFTKDFGNPASVSHAYGWTAAAAVEKARGQIAGAIGAESAEIIFTSGATEANNLAIKGVAEAYFSKGKHLITLVTEHSAVLDPCRYLETLGFEITVLPVEPSGLVSVEKLAAAMRSDTILVSVMAANNEIGVLQPIEAIGRLCRDRSVLFHTDAAQAIGKVPLDVTWVDLMSLTGHKVYGPKGIGALYVRRKGPRVRLAAQLHGGGHERGWRSGTLYTPQIVGFGEALALGIDVGVGALRDRLWQGLRDLPGLTLNGSWAQRLPGNLNFSVAGVDGTGLMLAIRDRLAVSSGSACSSVRIEPSHVLLALGVEERLAYASLRFGLGRFNTMAEVEEAISVVAGAIVGLRQAVK
ncbi:MAG: aminotransferase class V-fold PLP-dependent enzyme [Alkalinema sp. RU_4_3]|nr:aminotransferase class V-fold PLP-dependent enzyme [Alkalinema sp. RU_4_3]